MMRTRRRLFVSWLTVVFVALSVSAPSVPGQSNQPAGTMQPGSFRRPLGFVENRGQTSPDVCFTVMARAKTLFFRRDGITIQLRKGLDTHALSFDFVGARPDVTPVGRKPGAAVLSYFRGPDEDRWIRGAGSFGEIRYDALWPGIDLVCEAVGDRIKFTYVVQPGADPGRIRLVVSGAERVYLDQDSELHVVTPAGELVDEAPVAWQKRKGQREPVAVEPVLQAEKGRPLVRFRVERFDPERTLYVDPAFLVYCGYIGGEWGDEIHGVAVDDSGHLYVAGSTGSDETTFPVKVGPGLVHHGAADVFVAKVKLDGTGLVYCGYISSTDPMSSERAYGLALDSKGCVYITGKANEGYPIKAGPQPSNAKFGGFVTKLNASGTDIVYSGFVGGEKGLVSNAIAVDAAGNAYIAGEVGDDLTFPVKVGPDRVFNGSYDGFVAKVNAEGTDVVYCGYIGGASNDEINAVAVDGQGRLYVVGATMSNEKSFPVSVGPSLVFQGATIPGFAYDAFVARIRADGTGLDYCGYIGGNESENAYGVAVNPQGQAFVTGWTTSSDTTFPAKIGPSLTRQGGRDVFICRVASTGQGFDYCGFLGGAGWEGGQAVALDTLGAAYITGWTSSPETSFPVKHGPGLRFTYLDDAFVARVKPDGTGLTYCGYIGGMGRERGNSIAVDRSGNAYVGGRTESDETSFPVRVGPDLTFNEFSVLTGDDAFVAKIALVLLEGTGNPCPGGRVDFDLMASDDAGFPYQLASSFGPGPIAIDSRTIDLTYDGLLWISLSSLIPSMFVDYAGTIGSDGHARAALHLPGLPQIVGLKIHSAFVTLEAGAPSGVRSISNPYTFTITP